MIGRIGAILAIAGACMLCADVSGAEKESDVEILAEAVSWLGGGSPSDHPGGQARDARRGHCLSAASRDVLRGLLASGLRVYPGRPYGAALSRRADNN